MAIKTIIATEGQTIFDLALQLYGDVSKAYDLIALNSNIPNITSNDLEGFVISFDDPKNETTEFYKVNNVTISTRYPEIDSGVYYLQQENEFYLLQENNFKLII